MVCANKFSRILATYLHSSNLWEFSSVVYVEEVMLVFIVRWTSAVSLSLRKAGRPGGGQVVKIPLLPRYILPTFFNSNW